MNALIKLAQLFQETASLLPPLVRESLIDKARPLFAEIEQSQSAPTGGAQSASTPAATATATTSTSTETPAP